MHRLITYARIALIIIIMMESCTNNTFTRTPDKTPGLELVQAAAMGDYEWVTELIDTGAPITACNEQGQTALMLASKYGHQKVVDVLCNQHSYVSDTIIDTQDNDGMTALMYGAQAGEDAIVTRLLACNATQNIKNYAGQTAQDVAEQKIERIQKTLSTLHNSPANAQKNLAPSKLIADNAHDWFLAAQGNFDKLTELIDTGFDVNTPNEHGQTALMLASKTGNRDIVNLLCRQEGIMLNTQDRNGWTALMYAAQAGNQGIVSELLAQKANGLIKNYDGQIAHDIAHRYLYDHVATLLPVNKKQTDAQIRANSRKKEKQSLFGRWLHKKNHAQANKKEVAYNATSST